MSTTVTVDFFSTLDGYGSAEGWPGYWGKEGPELIEDRVRAFAQDQVLVFGATTFREFSKFIKLFDEPYYDSLTALPKIVFSSTLEEPLEWPNSTVLNEDAVFTSTNNGGSSTGYTQSLANLGLMNDLAKSWRVSG
jgi:hypothetical protein